MGTKGRAAALAVVLIVGLALAWMAGRTPSPEPSSVAAIRFSAARAMLDDRIIAARPHPIGSPAAIAARAYIFHRMTVLGLNPGRVDDEAVYAAPRWKGAFATGGRIENLVGVLAGQDHAAPALLMMAHTDSVPGSPGAADDAAGVISILETIRALEADGPHRRDVIVLFTDGEEAGLLGAQAFFTDDPLARRVGQIINLESRGGGGRVSMFETGANDGASIAAFAHAVHRTNANSLMSEIYKYLPNSTDFTVAKAAGYPGFNFAFLGEEFDYHSPSSTPGVLDQGSVQDMGDQALALARRLVDAPRLPSRAPDAVYSDAVGGPVLAYPAWMAWLLFAEVTLAVGLASARGAARTEERLSLGATTRGAGAALATTLFVALALHAAGRWIGDTGGLIAVRNLMAQSGALLTGMGLLACGLALAAWSAAFRGVGRFRIAAAAVALGLLAGFPHGFDPFALGLGLVAAVLSVLTFGQPLRRWNGWLGGLLVGVVLNLILLLHGPPLSMVVAWPLVLASLLALVIALIGRGRFERPAALLAAVCIGVLAFGQVGHLGDQVFTAVGVGTSEALALVVLLLGWSFYPLLEGWGDWRGGPITAVAIAAAGGLTLAFVALHDPATARTPHAVQAFYLADPQTRQAWRASTLKRLDPWSAAALGKGVRRTDLEPALGEVWLAPTPTIPLTATTLIVSRDPASGRRLLQLRPQNGGRDLKIYLHSNGSIGGILAEGRPTGLALTPGHWALLHWAAPGPNGVTLSLPPGSQTVEVRTVETIDGWPSGAVVPPKPPATMPWPPSDSTLVIGRYRAAW